MIAFAILVPFISLIELGGTASQSLGKESTELPPEERAYKIVIDGGSFFFQVDGAAVSEDALNVMIAGQVPAGYGYTAMAADGIAKVMLGIDMSMIMEKLNLVPKLFEVVIKLERVINGEDTAGKGGMPSGIIVLVQRLFLSLENQNSKIDGLAKILMTLEKNQKLLFQRISQVLAVPNNGCIGQLQGIAEVLEYVKNAVDGIIQILQGGEQRIGGMTPDEVNILQNIFTSEGQNTLLLERIGSLILQLSNRTAHTCNSPVGPPSENGNVLERISFLLSVVQRIPQVIIEGIQKGAPYGGPSLITLTEIIERLAMQLETTRKTISESRAHFAKLLAEQKNHLVAVKKVVTTELVQANAAAAAAAASGAVATAARSLNCPTLPSNSTSNQVKKKEIDRILEEPKATDRLGLFNGN